MKEAIKKNLMNKRAVVALVLLFIIFSVAIVLFVGYRNRSYDLTVIFPEMSQVQKSFITPLVTSFELQSSYRVQYEFRKSKNFYDELHQGHLQADLYYFVNNFQLDQLEKTELFSSVRIRQDENLPELFFSDATFTPVSWYPWGIFYNKSLFRNLNLSIPETWDEFLELCEIVKVEGYTPLYLMTKIKWPSTIWFDYLDILFNGEDFHRELLAGEIPFTDNRVRIVFSEILNLHKNEYFLMESGSTEWQSMIKALEEENALMCLSGSFFYENAPESLQENLGWFPFPEVSTLVASSSGFVFPKESKNRRGAIKFLEYVLSEEGQGIIQRNSDLIAVHPSISGGLDREDLNSAVSQLYKFESIMPSLERNTHEILLIPIKSAVNFLYSVEDESQLDTLLEQLEKYRKNR